MSTPASHEPVSRRGFLKTALAMAAGATAAGAGLTWLDQRDTIPALAVPPTPPIGPGRLETTLQIGRDTAALMDQLVAAHAENLRLRTELDAANRRFAAQSGRREPAEAMETLSLELADAEQRLGALAGLVALYEQLDSVDLDGALDRGLGVLGEALGDLVAGLPGLRDGLAAGEAALVALEEEIPLLESGRLWLDQQLGKLGAFHEALEAALLAAVDRVGSFLELLEGWFADVLRWLPFGIGRKASAVMAALASLLTETPHTISGLRVNVAGPLDLWLAPEEGARRIERRLVQPVRHKALGPATAVADRAEQAHAAFRQELGEPTTRAVASRRILRDLIAHYRETHDL